MRVIKVFNKNGVAKHLRNKIKTQEGEDCPDLQKGTGDSTELIC